MQRWKGGGALTPSPDARFQERAWEGEKPAGQAPGATEAGWRQLG